MSNLSINPQNNQLISKKPMDPIEQLTNLVSLTSKQDQICWQVFSIFWPTNALLLVALLDTGILPKEKLAASIVFIVGIAFSIVWTIFEIRCLAFLKYYENITQVIEKDFLITPPEIAISGSLNKVTFNKVLKGTVRIRPIVIATGIVSSVSWIIALLCYLY